MKKVVLFGLVFIFSGLVIADSSEKKPDFSTGIIGTSFVSNGGSSTYEYKVLIDFRIHGRHTVELKFVERNNYDERDLAKREHEELVMVHCTKRTYTTSEWLIKNNNNFGYKKYKDGDAISWDDKSEIAYANYGNGWMLPIYFKMVCDSL
ncbi:MAG: hypothetical protein WAV95_18090 [Azonexus sp.]